MKRIFQKIDQLRASGKATLNVRQDSPYSKFNGITYSVVEIGKAEHKCRVSLKIEGQIIHFTLCDIL
ncbi:hypothetical protein [Pedobacter sp. SYSU D00535]|uniref:hypothetical protein n=1 Tax=Pedobacter sp. SYSU D00535 TaxID=2810308 RepID=UPI001A963B6F|nr:hypothetical protein [Pedobacter sp. SYSU D00535]